MRAQTLKAYQWVHTWTGIVAGLALFIAFLAGALTLFQDDIARWERPAARYVEPTPADIDRLAAALLAAHPAAAERFGIMWPTGERPDPVAFWFEQNDWHFAALDRAADRPALVDIATPRLSAFINRLHYSLALPGIGLYLMGTVSVAFGFALVSGLLVHWPRLAKDLFALRPGKNRKRFWQDAHNALGVFALPFYAMIAVTGAIMCLSTTLAFVFNLVFDHQLAAALPAMREPIAQRAVPGSGTPPARAGTRTPLPLVELVAAAQRHAPELVPEWITCSAYGKPDGVAEVWGNSEGTIGSLGSVALRIDDGRILGRQTREARDANHAIGSAIYGLHFGTYGGAALQWTYFVLGIAGAALVFTGNLMWLEARRKRHAKMQPRSARNVARATIAVCLGTCAALAAAFVGALLWPHVDAARVFGVALLAAVAYTAMRPPILAARDLLATAALLSLAVVIADCVATANGLPRALARHDWGIVAIDVGALVAAALFALSARLAQRRATRHASGGVWDAH